MTLRVWCICTGALQRTFLLVHAVEVGEELMKTGLLHIDLKRALPKRVIQKIKIKRG